MLPPGAIGQVPFDGLGDAVGEFGLREPAQLVVDLGGVDSVAHIVSLPVGHVDDEGFRFIQRLADELHDVDVAHLVVAAYVINFTDVAVVDDEVDGPAVILHVQPIPHVDAFAVHGQGLVVQGVGDHEGDEFLGEVVGAVVVAAPADGHGQVVGAVVCLGEQVGSGLGGGIRAGGVDGGIFCEEQVRPVQGQVAVHLVGGDLVVADVAVLPAGVQQHLGAHDVGLQEDGRVLNAPVYVALGGEVDD